MRVKKWRVPGRGYNAEKRDAGRIPDLPIHPCVWGRHLARDQSEKYQIGMHSAILSAKLRNSAHITGNTESLIPLRSHIFTEARGVVYM